MNEAYTYKKWALSVRIVFGSALYMITSLEEVIQIT